LTHGRHTQTPADRGYDADAGDISLSRALIKLCPYQSICDTDGSDSDEKKSGEIAGNSEIESAKYLKRASINVSPQR
jgi:hypothetical protein